MEKDSKRKPEGKTSKPKVPAKRKGKKGKGTKCVWTTIPRVNGLFINRPERPPKSEPPSEAVAAAVVFHAAKALEAVGFVRGQLKAIKAPALDYLTRILEGAESHLRDALRANGQKPPRPAKHPKRIGAIHRPHSSRGHTHVILERAVWNTGPAADANLA
jgi:hypothetical protein